MTDEQLLEIEQACAGATPKPWHLEEGRLGMYVNLLGPNNEDIATIENLAPENAEVMCGARSWLPLLCREVRELRKQAERDNRDLTRSACTNCGGSGWYRDSTEGGIEAKCHCWANYAEKLLKRAESAESSHRLLVERLEKQEKVQK